MSEKRFLSVDDLTHLPKPAWLIEGLFEANSLIMLAGAPATFKSFLALDWIMCMATGRKWADRPTTPAKVLYVLGEGKASLLKRIQAWATYHNITPEEESRVNSNFRISFEVPQMASKASVDNMLSSLSAEGYEPSVIVIDTFARSFVGMDENSQKDVGVWVESADRLRNLGYTVIFIHHTKKSAEFGAQYRGSSAIMGAMDTAMTMTRTETEIKVEVSKQKDHDEGQPLYFNKRVIRPDGHNEEGSIVLIPAVMVDERFSGEVVGEDWDDLIQALLSNPSYGTDSDRAKVLMDKSGLNLVAAKTRISRARRKG